MVLDGQFLERFLDLIFRCVLLDPYDLVVVITRVLGLLLLLLLLLSLSSTAIELLAASTELLAAKVKLELLGCYASN